MKDTDPEKELVSVIGGHSGTTIVPLLSKTSHKLEGKELDDYVHRVQFGGDEVVKAKDGAGSATLSMAMAGARFAGNLLEATNGEEGRIEPSFVESPLFKDQGVDFFASEILLGPEGVSEILPVDNLSPYEQKLLDVCLKELKVNIQKGMCLRGSGVPAQSRADYLFRCKQDEISLKATRRGWTAEE